MLTGMGEWIIKTFMNLGTDFYLSPLACYTQSYMYMPNYPEIAVYCCFMVHVCHHPWYMYKLCIANVRSQE